MTLFLEKIDSNYFSVQQNRTLSKLYAKDFGQDVVVTKNNTKQVQNGIAGVIKSQSTESYLSEVKLGKFQKIK